MEWVRLALGGDFLLRFGTQMKESTITLAHLEWLVKSRADNQSAAVKLFGLFDKYEDKIKQRDDFAQFAYNLVAICFSLWRAAFLADKMDNKEELFQNAKAFLEKILIDNAITYPTDRNAREWTFSYYVISAGDRLRELPWKSLKEFMANEIPKRATLTWSQHRWDIHQKAFEIAVECLRSELESGAPETSATLPESPLGL